MSWRLDEAKGMSEDYRHNPAERTCINCGDYSRTVDDDGWCDTCAGRLPSVGAEQRKTLRATLDNARKILALKEARIDPHGEIAWWRKHVAWLEKELGLEPGAAA